MPLRDILHQWDEAVKAYKAGQYTEALTIYRNIEELSARMYYNMSCAHVKLDEFSEAIECLSSAVEKDTQLAIAFFHRGLLHLKLDRLSEAKADLHVTLDLMRGNSVIDYKQLGLLLKLFQSEVLYNIAVTEIRQGDLHAGEDTLQQSIYTADIGQRQLIQEALNHMQNGNISGIQPQKPPVDSVFTPPKVITDNLEKRKYVPKARVVSAANNDDFSPTFNGEKRVQEIRRFSEFSAAIKPPKSPLLLVRKVFRGERKMTPGMRLNKSTGDLIALAKGHDLPSEGQKSPLKEPHSAGAEIPRYVNDIPQPNNKRTSMGLLFGNNLAVISKALSSSCGILTAFAIPSVHVANVLPANDDARILYTGETSCKVKEQKLNKTNVTADQVIANSDVELDMNCSVTPNDGNDENGHRKFDINSAGTHKSDSVTEISSKGESQNSPVANNRLADGGGDINELNNITDNLPVKRQRPPPPSYPPPPLPSTIIAQI